MTKVSNSQIMDWQKCHKRFEFSQIMKLKPLDFPVPMIKGLGGHSIMEVFFNAMKEGKPYEECVSACDPVLITLASNNPAGLEVYRHVLAFGAIAFQEEWDIQHVEQIFSFDIAENRTFVFQPDLIYRATKGIYKGRLIMLDFKFTGQYWTEHEIAVYQQIPKYAAYYKKITGEAIRAAYVVMLNTRANSSATGDKLLIRKPIDLNKKKLANIVEENEILVDEVASAKENRDSTHFVRTVDTYACKMCFFAKDLCPMDLAGHDIKRTAETLYEVNDYFDQYEAAEGNGL